MNKAETLVSLSLSYAQILDQSLLVSHPSGKEAWLAFQPTLNEIPQSEEVVVDFEGVVVLAPSWADEFLSPLRSKFKKVRLQNTDNPSVTATLEILFKQ